MLGAFGLLDNTRVRLPVGLVTSPIGWLEHSLSVARQPASTIALLDAVKPLLGVSGATGVLDLATGVRITVSDDAGAIKIVASVDTPAFGAALGSTVGRLVGGVTAGVLVGSGTPAFSFAAFAGLPGSVAGTRAVHVEVTNSVRVILRPAVGASIVLYPPGTGLAAAAVDQVVGQALPFLLDKLAEQTGGVAGQVGAAVAAIGDALKLRDATPTFSYGALQAFAANPTAALSGAANDLAGAVLTELVNTFDAVLPASVGVATVNGNIDVTAGPVMVRLRLNPFRIEIAAAATTLPGIGSANAALAFDISGLDSLLFTIGPIPIDVGPVQVRPVLSVAAGANPVGGRAVSLGLDLDGSRRVVARWVLGGTVQLVVVDGPTVVTDPGAVVEALIEAVAALAASVALATAEVQALLNTSIPGTSGATTVRQLLDGVILTGGNFDPGVFEPDTLLPHVVRLIDNLAGAGISVAAGDLTIGISRNGGVAGITVGLTNRFELPAGDVVLALEVDDSWIDPKPPLAGVTVGLVRLAGSTIAFDPSLTISGVGLRISKASGPLLDVGVTLDSIALHAFASLGATHRAGGVQLQFSNLAISPGGASGGNPIAQGILADTGSPTQKPQPKFSPALAIQKHGNDTFAVSLRAGSGDGPWWIAIQKGFGPLYIEQIGLGVTMPQRRVESISLIFDARVSLFGLAAAVDDLSITYFVSSGSFFNPSSWKVDLARVGRCRRDRPIVDRGWAIEERVGRKRRVPRHAARPTSGSTASRSTAATARPSGVVAFFAVGAVVGPIGGPPAFFVTGIGGGFGINRDLVVPTDLSQFGTYPLDQGARLARRARRPDGPAAQLGAASRPSAGKFWFAGGISFTSSRSSTASPCVAMQFGDGFEISLLGLARMALPDRRVRIVSIELALVARISTRRRASSGSRASSPTTRGCSTPTSG